MEIVVVGFALGVAVFVVKFLTGLARNWEHAKAGWDDAKTRAARDHADNNERVIDLSGLR